MASGISTVSSDPLDSLTNLYQRPITIESDRLPTVLDVHPPMTSWQYGKGGPIYVSRGDGQWDQIASSTGDVNSLEGDSGGPVFPQSGNINIVGDTGLTVSGSGDTLTISLTGGGVAIDSFIPDAGTDPVVPDANGAVTMAGTADEIITTGGTNSLTFSLSPTLVAPGSLEVTEDFEVLGGDVIVSADSIELDATASSYLTVTGASIDLTLSSVGGSVAVSSTENAAGAIALSANGGTSETITLTAAQGTGADSISLSSTAGGVTIAGGLATTDAINLAAAAGGVDIDGALEVSIRSSEAAVADAVTISASAADGGITLDAGATPGVTFTNGTQSFQFLVGTGSPNGSVTASQGSLYVDVAGNSAVTVLYCNTNGTTGWSAVGVGA